MALPTSPSTTYVASSTPSIKAQDLNDLQTWLAYLYNRITAAYGSGADGTVTLDGVVAAPAGIVKVGTVYTLQRDFYPTTLTITGASTVLKLNGYRLLGRTAITVTGGAGPGAINADGLDCTSFAVAGAASPTGSLLGGAAGGNGSLANAGATGSAGSASTNALSGNGGAGGASGTGVLAGAGGAATAPASTLGGASAWNPVTAGYIFGISAGAAVTTALKGGAGGGGGGAQNTGTGGGLGGGGGGGGGGVAVVAARSISLLAANNIRVKGGVGGNGSGSGGSSGGGGGGSGGLLIIAYADINVSLTAAACCPGGAAGSGFGIGLAGTVGADGFLLANPL